MLRFQLRITKIQRRNSLHPNPGKDKHSSPHEPKDPTTKQTPSLSASLSLTHKHAPTFSNLTHPLSFSFNSLSLKKQNRKEKKEILSLVFSSCLPPSIPIHPSSYNLSSSFPFVASQGKSAMGAHEEGSRRKTTVVMDTVVCPKPRRLNDQIRPLRLPFNHRAEMGDEEAGTEILDIILTKVGYVGEKPGYQVASSPPFYCGSPPSRASNPMTQDANFVNGKITQLSLADSVSPSPGSSLASECQGRGGGVRIKYRNMPAAVRIEGFDCLSRDRRHCSISAMA